MTELKQAVEAQPGEGTDSATKQQGTAARNRKPAVPGSQTKSPAKSPARKTAFPSRSGASVSKMKANAARAEALEHENVAVQNKRTSHSHTDATDVSGVIVPSDKEEMNIIEQERPMIHEAEKEGKHGHKKEEHKHHSNDKKEHSTLSQIELVQENAAVTVEQPKHLDILKKKALKSEKKVEKLKKKVHKAEKKQVKTSKIRALKEKLTKAFAKWQRRKKRVEETT